MSGPDRAVVYVLAAATGYRIGELAALTPADFHLDDHPPTVRLSGEHTKNGKDASQPIQVSLADKLRVYLAGRRATARVWPGWWHGKGTTLLKHDLAAAGLQARTARGEAVFHSLRHSYASMLVMVAPASVAHELARHGDVATTLKHYAHASDAAKLAAVNAMPLPGAANANASPLVGLSRAELEGLTLALWVGIHTILGGKR